MGEYFVLFRNPIRGDESCAVRLRHFLFSFWPVQAAGLRINFAAFQDKYFIMSRKSGILHDSDVFELVVSILVHLLQYGLLSVRRPYLASNVHRNLPVSRPHGTMRKMFSSTCFR